MDFLSLLRTFASLAIVLGLLVGALWIVRRYDLKLPVGLMGGLGTGAERRVQLMERLSIDGRHSIALIRRDDIEHLVLIGPAGAVSLESGISAPKAKAAGDA